MKLLQSKEMLISFDQRHKQISRLNRKLLGLAKLFRCIENGVRDLILDTNDGIN